MRLHLAVICIICLLPSCVQKTYERTVIYKLQIPDTTPVSSVGVKGRDEPLQWQKEQPLTQVDSNIYTTSVTYQTGYLFTEVKFLVNGKLELEDLPNRTITFTGDTTVYNATFDVAPK